MNVSGVQTGKLNLSCFGKGSKKLTVFTFLALTLFVFINLLTSTSKMSVIVDMSLKMKSNIADVIHSITNISSVKPINGMYSLNSFAAQENDRDKKEKAVVLQFTDDSSLLTNVSADGTPNVKIEQVETTEINAIKKSPLADKVARKLNISSREDKSLDKTDSNPVANQVETNKVKPPKSKTESNEIVTNIVISVSAKENDGTHNDSDLDKTKDEDIEKKDEINKFGNRLTVINNTRKVNCASCFNHDFNYVINNEQICKLRDTTQHIDLIILILTTHSHTKARAALRNTWLTHAKKNTANVRYAFLLGETSEHKDRENTLKENDIFHDILMEDFIDTYRNLTYKTIMGFKWAATKCAHAQYVMKTDDDMFVNIPNVLKIFKGSAGSKLQSAIGGSCSGRAIPNRNLNSKWFASLKSYPEKSYPGFCSGTGYVTSMAVATKVYEISPSVPFFHLEDVYVSLCIRTLGFRLQTLPGFNPSRPSLNPCLYKGGMLVTAHQLSPIMLQMIWQQQCMRHATNAGR